MSFATIVVGTDGSSLAETAVSTAIGLAAAHATVHVVTAYDTGALREVAAFREQLPAEFRTAYDPLVAVASYNEAAVRRVEAAGLNAVAHLADGDPADLILGVADESDAELIVVGSRGRSTLQRWVLGSVSAKLAHHATRSLLIVHPRP